MKQHRLANIRHRSHNAGQRFQSPATVTALPKLTEGQVRCECGKGVRLKDDGTLRNHRTLISKVLCIRSGSEPGAW